MTNLRQAAQQALEALEWAWGGEPLTGKEMVAIAALRAALAEPEQEPISLNNGRLTQYRDGSIGVGTPAEPEQAVAIKWTLNGDKHCGYSNWLGETPFGRILITWKSWKDLSDACVDEFPGGFWAYGEPDEVKAQCEAEFCRRLGTAPPQREHITDGSPCWCNPDVIEEEGGDVIVHNYEDNWQQYAKPGETAQQCIERHRGEQDALMKLYATPRRPLTEEEIVRLMVGEDRVQLLYAKPGDPYFSEFAEGAIRELVESGRAIERAHGITGEGANHG